MSEKIKNCPFCGSDYSVISILHGKGADENDIFQVVCRECGARSGKGETEKEVRQAWNERAETEKEPTFYDIKDIARLLNCSIPTARNIFHRQDFPLISTGKNMRVSKQAFEKWAMERRT